MLKGYIETEIKRINELIDEIHMTVCHLECRIEDLKTQIDVLNNILKNLD